MVGGSAPEPVWRVGVRVVVAVAEPSCALWGSRRLTCCCCWYARQFQLPCAPRIGPATTNTLASTFLTICHFAERSATIRCACLTCWTTRPCRRLHNKPSPGCLFRTCTATPTPSFSCVPCSARSVWTTLSTRAEAYVRESARAVRDA